MDKIIKDAEKMTVKELKAELKARGITLNANKAIILERLVKEIKRDELERLHGADIEVENEFEGGINNDEPVDRKGAYSYDETLNQDANDDTFRDEEAITSSDSDSESDDPDEGATATLRTAVRTKGSSFTFKDVEESLQRFSGDRKQNLRKWIKDFELNAKVLKWSKVQKFVYAKRLLTGAAKMFTNVEVSVTSYKQLKACLKDEFGQKLSSVKIHKELMVTKKLHSETYREYLYRMMAIAEQANIELESTFQYVIDGINDIEANKSVLYGVTTLREFKKRLDAYELMKSKSTSNSSKSDKFSGGNKKNEWKMDKCSPKDDNKPNLKNRRCFRCGSSDHDVKKCTNELKCFRCNKTGHISKDCTDAEKPTSSPKLCNAMVDDDDAMMKDVKLSGYAVPALVDTGSPYTLIRLKVFYKIGAPILNAERQMCKGVGKGLFETLGSFERQVEIDGKLHSTIIHVAADDDISYDMIIGKPLIRQTGLIFDDSGLSLTKHNELLSIKVDEIRDDVVDLNHLDKSDRQIIRDIIANYRPYQIKTTNIELKILLTEEKEIFQRPRRLSEIEKAEVDRITSSWLNEKIIRPSNSRYAQGVVLSAKKDGSTRLCVDYRRLNRLIIPDRYPLPLIDDQLDALRNAKYFTKIDLKNGFFHINVHEDSVKYTAFVTHNNHFEFLKMPFGLKNGSAMFMRYINIVLRDLMQQGILLIYLDDVIIISTTIAEGIERFRLFLQVAADYGLQIAWHKCEILQREVEYVGHIVSFGSIAPQPRKTAAVMNFPPITTLKQLSSFLGLSGYFRKFIESYAAIARPLKELERRQTPFIIGPAEQYAIDSLKQALASKPVLKMYHPDRETELHTDASKYGYGAMLLQRNPEDMKLHPIYYSSRKTTDAEQKYHSYELEVLAIISSLKKFRHYLLGISFKIFTDCSAFEQTMKKRELTTRVARWALLLEEFDYILEHRSGSRMRHVDALSRYPINVITRSGTAISTAIKNAQVNDDHLKTVRAVLANGPYQDFLMKNDVLYRMHNGRELLVIPKKMQFEIIRSAHDNGHFAVKKVEELILREYYFDHMKDKISSHIKNCVKCILAERKHGKQEGFLHEIEKADVPMDTWHVDHLGPLASTAKQYHHIFAIIDAFTKFVWLFPVRSTTSAEVISKLKIVQSTFGNPRRIVNDRGTAFTSKEFTDYLNEHKIGYRPITTGVPRSNGQVERLNTIIIAVLTKLSVDHPMAWYRHVDRVQKCINSTYQRSIGTTPFQLMFGTKMRQVEDILLAEWLQDDVIDEFCNQREILRADAKRQILKVQSENKKNFNQRRKTPHTYNVDDIIAIKRTQFGPGLKLRGKFLGPYRVTSVNGMERYDVVKVGDHEGPNKTSTCAEFMKPWSTYGLHEISSESDEC